MTKLTLAHPTEAKRKPEIRVLHVISALGMGGAETWIMAIIKRNSEISAHIEFDIKIDICLTSGQKSQFDEEAKTYGTGLHYIEFSRRNLKNFVTEFRSLLSSENYDVIHDHQDCLAGVHFLIGLGVLPKVKIAHVHNTIIHIDSYASSLSRKITVSLGKASLAMLATHILGTSNKVLNDYSFDSALFSRVRRRSLHCGFNVARFSGVYEQSHKRICGEFKWPVDSKVILFVGRLESNQDQKNPGFAIDVFAKCVEQDVNLRLLMVGDCGSSLSAWEEKIHSLVLDGNICLAGVRNDLNEIMPGADLLLFPSKAEGLGMVNVEAQAAGVRVLASDSTPNECVVLPNMVTFKSLEEGASSWSEDVLDILRMPKENSKDCNNAVECSHFSISQSFSNLMDIYSTAKI